MSIMISQLKNELRNNVDYDGIVGHLGRIVRGSPFENHVFTVGGCERDRLMGKPIKDIDIVIDLPNGGVQFAQWLESMGYTHGHVVVYEHYGTAMFKLKEFPYTEIEAVQTRKECYRNMESRNPETAYGSIEEDCRRRDFTINAIYRNISTGRAVDYTGRSLKDLENRVIISCGEPDIIFSEDPLRILRAVRFTFKYDGFRIEEETYRGMCRNVNRLGIVSQERITDEFSKMICSDFAYESFEMLRSIGALRYVIPFNREGGDMEKFYLRFLIIDPSINKVPDVITIRLSRVFSHLLDGEIKTVMRNMRYPTSTIDNTIWFANHSDWSVFSSDVGLRRYIYDARTLGRLRFCMKMFRALGYDTKSLDKRIFQSLNFKFIGYKLPVDGNDVMKGLNVAGGPLIGKILDELLNEAFRNPLITKEECMDRAAEIKKENDGMARFLQ